MRTVLLQFTFKLLDGMILDRLTVHTKTLNRAELDAFRQADQNTIKGSMEIKTAIDEVLVHIAGIGKPFQKGSFNLMVGTKKVFEEDQPLKVKANRRIIYLNETVTLP